MIHKMHKRILPFWILLALLSSGALAGERDPTGEIEPTLLKRGHEIVQIAQATYVNQDLHREFWEVAKKSGASPRAISALAVMLQREQEVNEQWLRQSWLDVSDCLRTRQVVQSAQMVKAASELRQFYATWRESLSDVDKYLPDVDKYVLQNRALCEAATVGTAFQSSEGAFYVTQDLVREVLDGLPPSMARVRRLLNPIWDDSPREQLFSDIGLKLFSPEVFTPGRLEIQADNGIRVRNLMYITQLDENRVTGVTGVVVEGSSSVSDQMLLGMLKGAAERLDAKLSGWEVSAVAGSTALKGCMHDLASQGWYCMLAVAGKRSGLAYMFMGGAASSAEAQGLMDALVHQIEFLD